ncbi:hypothetical protein AZI87_15960 [Bdellovibrio bacteriovorus]|uniref:Uncharacterized protein n=1 Tax=Bdellovibrio bacteriovorus TaxID=959 RepID=A0A162FYD2_BDEBC|nr:hypothetical protein [Bdellovibrio bacteriovorus]KYG62771.1 hypothetical protein AZI87_15960 [Bdellovibrio bacteriovorus]
MKQLSVNLLVFSFLISTSALASQELKNVVRCHEALNDKSEGRSHKLGLETATPIVLPWGKHLYFITDSSSYVIDNKYSGKEAVFRLEDSKMPYVKISFQANGEIGGMSYAELSKEEKQKAEAPKAKLDGATLAIFKKDLVRRMNSVTGEYQNKYDPQGTIDALLECRNVNYPELQKSLDKQLPFYEKLLKKSGTKKYQQKESSGQK